MKRPRIGLVARREMKGYLFLLPWLIGFIAFFALPLGQSFYYSLNDVKITAAGRKSLMRFARLPKKPEMGKFLRKILQRKRFLLRFLQQGSRIRI